MPTPTYSINLLSDEEQKTLKPVIRIMDTVLKMHEQMKSTDIDDELNQQMNNDFEALCKKRRLNKQKLLELAVQVMNSKWFCVYLSGGDVDENGIPKPMYSFVISDHPNIQTLITQEEYPDFFTIGSRISASDRNLKEKILIEYRTALKLAKEYKSIDADHVDAVLSIYEVFGDNPKKINIRPLKYGWYLGDKVNALKLWEQTEKANKKNLFVGYDSASLKSGKRVGIGLKINFDGVPANLTKSLTRYDKFVYSSVFTLFMSGFHTVTASMIYGAMGNKSRPSQKDIQRVNDSLTKMGTVRVFVDNSREREEYPSYPPFSYDEILLDFVRVSKMEVNGHVSESAIRIKTEPVMGRFARERNQIRKIDMKLLEAPISNTENQLAVKDYLIYVVTYPNVTTRKITHEMFFERVGASDRKQRQRALDAAERLLAYYKEQKQILDYKMEADGILIVVKKSDEPDKISQDVHKK